MRQNLKTNNQSNTMTTTTEQGTEGVLVIKVTTTEADYRPEVEKNLRELRRKANMPGFRPGMVPAGVINKMYGKGVRAEQAYRKAHEAVGEYLEENKIEIVADVMPSDTQGELSFEPDVTEHEFVFEVAPAPVVDVTLDGKDKLTHYKITPSKEMVEAYAKSLEATVEDETERTKQATERAEADLERESDWFDEVQLKNLLLAKANVKLPEEFLRRWLVAVNEGKFSAEEVERDFAPFLRMMSWGLIQRSLMEKLEMKIEPAEVETEARAMAAMQFAQYGMRDVPAETLDGFAKSILADREQAQRVAERVAERKVLEAMKPLAKVSEKKVTVEEFGKIVGEAQQQ